MICLSGWLGALGPLPMSSFACFKMVIINKSSEQNHGEYYIEYIHSISLDTYIWYDVAMLHTHHLLDLLPLPLDIQGAHMLRTRVTRKIQILGAESDEKLMVSTKPFRLGIYMLLVGGWTNPVQTYESKWVHLPHFIVVVTQSTWKGWEFVPVFFGNWIAGFRG